MRFAVLSDIHGNTPALRAVLEDLDHGSLDGFILAGDYTGCPQAVETIRLLRGLKGWMIQGKGEAGSYLARSFLISIESGRNVAESFLTHAYRLKQRARIKESECIPDDI